MYTNIQKKIKNCFGVNTLKKHNVVKHIFNIYIIILIAIINQIIML